MSKVLLALTSLLVLVFLWVPGSVTAWAFAVAAAVLPVLVLGLRAAPRSASVARRTFLALALLLPGSTVGILVISSMPSEPRWGSLPASLVVMLLGLWVVPFLVSSWGYGAGFDADALSDENLERLRRLGREQAEKEGRPWRS